MHVLRATALAAWLLAHAAASAVPAQVVLPGQQGTQEKPGNVAPHLLCTVCGERNYNLRDDGRRDNEGRVLAWCGTCRRDTPMRLPDPPASAKAKARGGRLVLPAPVTAPPTSQPASQTGSQTAPAAGRPASGSKTARPPEPGAPGPGDFIFAEVSRLKRIDDVLLQRAVENLIALGEPGLEAARKNLGSVESPALLVAARVLLRSGRPEDADLVRERLAAPLPAAAGTPLLDLLANADPVRVSPAFLAELLDHPHAGVRAGAQKRLAAIARAGTDGVDLLPLLGSALESRRAETRRRAVELVAGLDGEAATQALLARIADPSASVVAAVASALDARTDADLDARLLGLAFRDRWILRPGACALLAIVEREDRSVRPILDETRVEPLLAGMQSSDLFLSGACATSLAGIGFRSHSAAATAWLDRDVVDRLVTAVSGQKFHSDLPALSGPALRRLELLTGAGLGSDGPRWVEWWVKAREGFIARRAWLEIAAEDVPSITVRCLERGSKPEAFTLLGPDAPLDPAAQGQSVRLVESQARDLVAALEREGFFGDERLPGLRGPRGQGERTLEIALDVGGRARSKGFTFGPGRTEPWFDRAVALAREILDRNRWQRYPDPARHGTPHALWEEQASWWALDHTERERALRMKTLVLAALPAIARAGVSERRDEAIAELERLYREPGTAEPADFAYLVQALGAERFWSDAAERLLELALAAARSRPAAPAQAPGVSSAASDAAPSEAASTEAAPTDAASTPDAAAVAGTEALDAHTVDVPTSATPPEHQLEGAADPAPDRSVPIEQGRRLVDLLVEKFASAAADELPRVFAVCSADLANALAEDPRPTVRVAAARAIATGPFPADPDTIARLLRLLGDRDPTVEAAAVQALGARRVEAARTELLVRARLGSVEVRAAALRAIGVLRGELVLDALSLASGDADPKIRVAAADGLTSLRDPAGAPLLIEMLGDGEDTPTAVAARAGLLALGPKAFDQLLRVMNSSTHRSRREAALLLSRQGVPEAVPAMLAMLSSAPKDAHVASELAVLTAVDLRGEPDPALAWWNWWDGVVHDDSLAWFLSALSRAGETPPPRADFDGAGTRDARLYTVLVLARREANLVERARRELARMLGQGPGNDFGLPPPRGAARDAWIAKWRESVLAETASAAPAAPAAPEAPAAPAAPADR